jgi:DNA polymerase (family 10)
MDNQGVAKVLYEIADLLELQGVEWKPRAYRRAARFIESMSKDVNAVEDLESLPGVGEHIAKKIRELVDTGRLQYLEKLRKKTSIKYDELNRVEGLGPKRIKELYDKLGVKDLKSLQSAIKLGKVGGLEGFGKVLEKNFLESISFVKLSGERFLLGDVYENVQEIAERLKSVKGVSQAEVCGSIRRMKETVHDADLLVCSKNPSRVMKFFTSMKNVKKVVARGNTKASVLLVNGFQVDLRVVPLKSFGAALNYFTGSKSHNIALRRIALRKGWKLNEYGLFKGSKFISGTSEEALYKKLGLKYVEPEMRENLGELELSAKNKLPKLLAKVKGDLQMHSVWSDGFNSVKEMAGACKRLGYYYCAITDHAGKLKVAGAISADKVPDYLNDLAKPKFPVLRGAEVDVDSKGRLSLPSKVMDDFDLVIAAVHSGFRQSPEKLTARILKCFESRVHILAHPTGRLLSKRPGMIFDFDKVFKKASELGVVLEINAQPSRLDLSPELIRRANSFGCKFAVNTDAHSVKQLSFMKYGLGTARRGWLESKDVVNTYSLSKLKKIIS